MLHMSHPVSFEPKNLEQFGGRIERDYKLAVSAEKSRKVKNQIGRD